MADRTGQCLCGAVTYRLTDEPLATRLCFCRECQRIAAHGTVNLAMPVDAVEKQGELAVYTRTADSGNTMLHHFCPKCGTQMFGSTPARPHITMVRAGTLDDPSSIKPETVIWIASAPAWAHYDRGLELFDGQPPPPKPKA